MDGDKKMIELESEFAVIDLPKNTVSAELIIEVLHDGKNISVKRTMDYLDIQDAFKNARDGYIDDDDTFQITEEGIEYLKRLGVI